MGRTSENTHTVIQQYNRRLNPIRRDSVGGGIHGLVGPIWSHRLCRSNPLRPTATADLRWSTSRYLCLGRTLQASRGFHGSTESYGLYILGMFRLIGNTSSPNGSKNKAFYGLSDANPVWHWSDFDGSAPATSDGKFSQPVVSLTSSKRKRYDSSTRYLSPAKEVRRRFTE